VTGDRDVAVVGVGVKAPGGTSVGELWENLCAGRSTAEPYSDERLPPGTALLVSRVCGFDPGPAVSAAERRRYDRALLLALAAAQDAVDDVGPADGADGAEWPPPERRAVVCGVGFGAPATWEEQHAHLLDAGLRALAPLTVPVLMPSAAAALLSLRHGIRGPGLTVSAACASGATAIGQAMELLRTGTADVVLAGGLDSMVTYAVLCGFLKLDVMSRRVDTPDLASRPFDADRDGFVMGEGAGFLVLQRAGDAVDQGRRVLARITGHAATSDAYHLVAPDPDGEGALRCMVAALADARLSPDRLGSVNAHATGTVVGDLAEARAIDRLLGGRCVPVTAVKGTTGHLVGGSGAVEAVVSAWSAARGVVPPVAGLCRPDPAIGIDVVAKGARTVGSSPVLSTSFGFGGANTCLVIEPP
jgi:3-oxoacyl-[acyl-carrier-protein] synthase II